LPNEWAAFLLRQLRQKIDKERIAIIGLWFLMLTGIRLLMVFVGGSIWIGTFGAVALTFALFYVVIKFTPLRRYGLKVNAILSGWYQRKYFLYSAIATSTILAGLLLLTEYGYWYYGDKLVIFDLFGSNDNKLENTMRTFEHYPLLDKLAITVASTDKSLNGNYAKTTSFLLAEDLEVLSFIFVVRSKKNLFSR